MAHPKEVVNEGGTGDQSIVSSLSLAAVMDDQSQRPGRREPDTAPPHTPERKERDQTATMQGQDRGRPEPGTAGPHDPREEHERKNKFQQQAGYEDKPGKRELEERDSDGKGGRRHDQTALLNEKQRNYPSDHEKNREPRTAPPRVPPEQNPDKQDQRVERPGFKTAAADFSKYMKRFDS